MFLYSLNDLSICPFTHLMRKYWSLITTSASSHQPGPLSHSYTVTLKPSNKPFRQTHVLFSRNHHAGEGVNRIQLLNTPLISPLTFCWHLFPTQNPIRISWPRVLAMVLSCHNCNSLLSCHVSLSQCLSLWQLCHFQWSLWNLQPVPDICPLTY